MNKVKSRLGILFLILFLPMVSFGDDNTTVETNSTIVDENITMDENMTFVDENLTMDENMTFVDENLTMDENITFVDENITMEENLTLKIGMIQPVPMELVESVKSIDMQINHLLFLAHDLMPLLLDENMTMPEDENMTMPEDENMTMSEDENMTMVIDENVTEGNSTEETPMPEMDMRIVDMNITTLETIQIEVSKLSVLINNLQNDINLTITDENLSSALQQEVSLVMNDVEMLSSLIATYQENNETNLTMATQEITTHLLQIQKFFRDIPVDIYLLNTTEINHTAIIETIKATIEELKMIREEIETLKDVNGSDLQQRYDALLQKLDGAKSQIDAIKQAIDMNIMDNNEIVHLKAEADKVKLAIDEVKTLMGEYKTIEENTLPTIEKIQTKIDEVIGMLITHTPLPVVSDPEIIHTTVIDIPKGRSLISGNIDVSKLSSDIYAVWIVDGGNWYGYSPDESVREAIKAKYRLITQMIPAYKAVIVWAKADTTIEVENDTSFDATQYYGTSFSIHGTNNQDINTDNIICNGENDALTAIFKVHGDITSAYLPNAILEGMENFTSLYYNEGYYVLCEQKLGASNE